MVSDIGELVTLLMKNLKVDEYFPMIVRRGSVLEHSLNRLSKASFDPAKRLKVNLDIAYD